MWQGKDFGTSGRGLGPSFAAPSALHLEEFALRYIRALEHDLGDVDNRSIAGSWEAEESVNSLS